MDCYQSVAWGLGTPVSELPKHMPLKGRNFCRKRKQLLESRGMQEHKRPYASAWLKAAKCSSRSLSQGRLFPCHSSFRLSLNPSPCSWHLQIPVHPLEHIMVIKGDPQARLIWDTGLLCSHRTDIPWRPPQRARVVVALPSKERGQCRLKRSS